MNNKFEELLDLFFKGHNAEIRISAKAFREYDISVEGHPAAAVDALAHGLASIAHSVPGQKRQELADLFLERLWAAVKAMDTKEADHV